MFDVSALPELRRRSFRVPDAVPTGALSGLVGGL
jgi:hypothetical protein